MTAKKKPPKKPAGPAPDRLIIEVEWQDAIGEAVRKPKPAEGWPDRPAKKRRKRKLKA